MHAFSRLLLTELRNRRNIMLITLGADVLLIAAVTILAFHSNLDNMAFMMFLNIAVFVVVLLIPFMHGFSTWREEWKQHSIYHLLALPVPRTYLLITKYIAILVEILLLLAVTIVGLWIQHWLSDGVLFRAEPLVTFEWSKVILVVKLFLTATSLVFLCSMSTLLGKWIGKLSLLVTFLAFVVGLLVWIIVFANWPSFLTLLMLSLVFFGINVYLLEKKVGVE
ncbi:ABC-2 transporter permease [Paenibacillus sp. N3.4]|uniref:ABC-2 transporter permease n=1 Tax=Paenibacillus sp. N3.4 TaxID=2603222 RepID=UPI00164FCAC7|nr:ABC-2 transporter permease [Paenibacillus sp. N3.4]